jgi:hypothetical protein
MTEFFSSIFALFSFLILIYKFYSKVNFKLNKTPLKKLYTIQFYTGCAAFISSFLFHFRETTFTRNSDYFSAFASILIGLLVAINRLVLLKKPKILIKFQKTTLKIGLFYFIFHIYKMGFFKFDYFYNKIACGLMFFTSCLCNFATFLSYRSHPHARNIVYSISCLLMAGGVEILDVSPFFYLFDSHALWHLFMLISTPLYFEFVAGDIDMHSLKNE